MLNMVSFGGSVDLLQVPFLIDNPLKVSAMKVQILTDYLYSLTTYFYSHLFKGVFNKKETSSKSSGSVICCSKSKYTQSYVVVVGSLCCI